MRPDASNKTSGKKRADFGYLEHDASSIDYSVIHDIVFRGDHLGKVLYVVRGAINAEASNALLEAFDSQLLQQGSSRKDDGFVKTHQIGATQFAKGGAQYVRSVIDASPTTLNLFDSVDDDVVERCFLTRTLEQVFLSAGAHFGPARYKNAWSSFATLRRWLDNGKMSLMPHEDKAQLHFAKKDGFEIKNAEVVVAFNACLECSGSGGELKVWNLEPDSAFRADLGVTETGYPYPPELLDEVECISVKINPGDIYFLNANNLHGVTSMNEGQRLTAGRFIAAISKTKVIFWT
jgi:hypothetical protein